MQTASNCVQAAKARGPGGVRCGRDGTICNRTGDVFLVKVFLIGDERARFAFLASLNILSR